MKKPNVLLLGATGMLGNAVYSVFTLSGIKVTGTSSARSPLNNFKTFKVEGDVLTVLEDLFGRIKPTHVVNCIGLIRPEDSTKSIRDLFFINSYFPKVLERVCTEHGARLIHPSTDCVFSGTKKSELHRPNYDSHMIPDDITPYGISKYLGETSLPGHLTIRTSIIGREIQNTRNLLDWFLAQNESVEGYTNVMWNGITTLCWAQIVARIIQHELYTDRTLVQLTSPDIISKYELLQLFAKVFNKNIHIIAKREPVTDKTLVSSDGLEEIKDLIPPLTKQIGDLNEFYISRKLAE